MLKVPSAPRLWPVFAALAGAVPLVGAFLFYQVGMLAIHQVGAYRLWALYEVLSVLTVLAALVVAVLLVALGADRLTGVGLRVARTAYFFAVLAGLCALGLSLRYWTPGLAPRMVLLGVGSLAAALTVAFVRYREEDQAFVVKSLSRLGMLVLCVPFLALPWVLYDAWRLGPRPSLAGKLPSTWEAKADAPPRIILVTFDGMRARSTSLGRPGDEAELGLDMLAREATWYSHARAISDRTLVCLPALLSGVEPGAFAPHIRHGMNLTPKGLLTGLPGYLKQAGYDTFYATMLLNPQAIGLGDEFDRGVLSSQVLIWSEFQTLDYVPLRETLGFLGTRLFRTPGKEVSFPGLNHVLGVRHTFEQGREMLRRAEGRSFIWLHIGAPHVPYYQVPPIGTKEPLRPERYAKVMQHEIDVINEGKDPGGVRKAMAAYEAYVAYAERELGRFIRGLKQDGTWENSLAVVTSDHGENLVPRVMGHGVGPLRGDVVHIPLLVRQPHQAKGRRADQLVTHLDIVPTVLQAVFGRVPSALTGIPLGEPLPDRVLYTHGWFNRSAPGQPLVPISSAAYRGDYMFVVNRVTGTEALYNLKVDPLNRRDIAPRHPELTRNLRERTSAEQARFGGLHAFPADYDRYVPLPEMILE